MSALPTIPNHSNQLTPLRLQVDQIKHLTLRHGQLVKISVIKKLVGQKWLVGLQGRVLRATANIPLRRGQQLVATVSIENGRVLLRQRTAPIASLLEQLHSRGDAVSTRLIDAMMRSGLPLTPALYQELARRLKPKQQRDNRSAPHTKSTPTSSSTEAETIRLLTIAYKKRLPLNQRALNYISQPATREYSAHPLSPRATPSEMSIQLAAILRQRLQHNSPTTQSLLALFNHMQEGADHWVVVPLFLSALAIQGQLRLHLTGKPLRSADLVVAIQEEKYRWYIHIQLFDSRHGVITLYIPDAHRYRPLAARLAALRKTLQGYGEYQLRILQDYPDFDGFDSRALHRQGVDINA